MGTVSFVSVPIIHEMKSHLLKVWSKLLAVEARRALLVALAFWFVVNGTGCAANAGYHNPNVLKPAPEQRPPNSSLEFPALDLAQNDSHQIGGWGIVAAKPEPYSILEWLDDPGQLYEVIYMFLVAVLVFFTVPLFSTIQNKRENRKRSRRRGKGTPTENRLSRLLRDIITTPLKGRMRILGIKGTEHLISR